jgi:hypothetical protein
VTREHRPDRRAAPGRRLRRVALAAALAALATGARAAPAGAGIALVQDLGQAAAFGPAATLTTTGAVAAGDSILVFVATSNGAATLTCSDPVNGAYTTDVQVTTVALRSAICSRHSVQDTPGGTPITISSSFATNIAARAAEFAGLAATDTLDRTAQAMGNSTAPAVTLGASNPTRQADELLVAVGTRCTHLTHLPARAGHAGARQTRRTRSLPWPVLTTGAGPEEAPVDWSVLRWVVVALVMTERPVTGRPDPRKG